MPIKTKSVLMWDILSEIINTITYVRTYVSNLCEKSMICMDFPIDIALNHAIVENQT